MNSGRLAGVRRRKLKNVVVVVVVVVVSVYLAAQVRPRHHLF